VSHATARIKESSKLGFSDAVIPQASEKSAKSKDLSLTSIETLTELVARIAAGSNFDHSNDE
jgi:DNA repair protein RadA/Sms